MEKDGGISCDSMQSGPFFKKVANTIAVQEQTLYHLPTAVGSFSEASNTEVSFLLLPTKVFPFLRES